MPERRRKRHDVSTDPVRWREARWPSPKAWSAAYDGERPYATWMPTREVHAAGHETLKGTVAVPHSTVLTVDGDHRVDVPRDAVGRQGEASR
jgi:hypothetical protein